MLIDIDYRQLNNTRYINFLGEHLRSEFFNERNESRGCYNTFEVNNHVMSCGDRIVPWVDFKANPPCLQFKPAINNDDEYYTTYYINYKESRIYMMYHWDGDGTLIFELPNKFILVNSDCKKDKDWTVYASWETYHHPGNI